MSFTTTAVENVDLRPIPLEYLVNPGPTTTRPKVLPNSASTRTLDGVAQDNIESSTSLPRSTVGPSKFQVALTILQPCMINMLASFTNGIITVGLPAIARSIDLPRSLYLWPQSVYGLTAGSVLLIAGSITDIVGARNVELSGIFMLGTFCILGGFSQTGVQLVVYRALQGIAMAMHLPASVALVAKGVPQGRPRNFAFACLGLSQPLGLSIGLVVSGVMIDKVGWRLGFYICGGATLAAGVLAIWVLRNTNPKIPDSSTRGWKRVLIKVDWVGGVLASGGLAILAYILAVLSAELSTIRSASTIGLLVTSMVLLASFPFWMQYRERNGKSALVPNSLWKNVPFTSTCIMVAVSYGMIHAMEMFSSLYFQEVKQASTLTASLYLLPNLLVGLALNPLVGLFIHRVSARWLITISSVLCALAPLFMAIANPGWNYWIIEFWSQFFAPFSVDVLFTVGLIIISDSFEDHTQALAGAVFNTVAQFGLSLGVGLCQVVALGVMGSEGSVGHHSDAFDDTNPAELLKGYRASFWVMVGYMLVCGLIAIVGLRRSGKVGVKRE